MCPRNASRKTQHANTTHNICLTHLNIFCLAAGYCIRNTYTCFVIVWSHIFCIKSFASLLTESIFTIISSSWFRFLLHILLLTTWVIEVLHRSYDHNIDILIILLRCSVLFRKTTFNCPLEVRRPHIEVFIN